MVSRLLFAIVALALGAAAGSLVPEVSQTVRTAAAWIPLPGWARLQPLEPAGGTHAQDKADSHGHTEGEKDRPEGAVKMPPERIAAAKIEVAPVGKGVLARRLTVPGTVVPDANRIARVAAKVVGTVADLKKQLGDPVAKGEVVAVLESREVAEAKSEYLAAQANFDLQKSLFEREQSLFQKSITAEQQFLRARTAFTEAQLRLDLARQKLSALNVGEGEIAALSRQTVELQRYEIRSPITGRVVERLVDLGAPVGGEGQAKELFILADLSSVWIELSVPIADLPSIREGQRVAVATGASGTSSEGRIVFISPLLNQETRSARVIAALDNKDLTWRPGSYVTARILVEELPVDLRVPRAALQTVGGGQVVFVRTAEGFEKREVALGKEDEQAVEVVSGLDPGEAIAVANSFVLKAELGKAEAEHAH